MTTAKAPSTAMRRRREETGIPRKATVGLRLRHAFEQRRRGRFKERMSEYGPSESEPQAPSRGFSLARATAIAAIVFGLVLAAIAIAALMTEGSPTVPFDYGSGLE